MSPPCSLLRSSWLAASALLVTLALTPATAQDAAPLDTYLPAGSYDASVPTPQSVLGWNVGDWHVRHDQIVRYMEVLADASPRVTLETYAHSHEQRPLVLLTITSPANHDRIEDIRTAHLAAVTSGAERDTSDPVIAWLGYSVHGNEASAANAALVVAYHLAASQEPDVTDMLGSSVVLLDPCLNPDGAARFASWVNQHKGKVLVADATHREHREVWPGGRTNHYWFDLNRDWLLLTHPESRGRVEQFHRWRPHVLTDGHEMGTESTYFFQPGVPTRQNPRTPPRNLDLTRAIAEFHAKALDDIGSLYYSEERFDDFYYGKGSTYPDVHGSIGILFEQASSRGHLQENSAGELSFVDTVRNQVATSLSTLRATHALRSELLDHQTETVRTALSEARDDDIRGYIFGHEHDRARVAAMASILVQHQIDVHPLADETTIDDVRYEPGSAYVVPCDQDQYLLVKSLFETRTEFEDNTFYDVSTWTLPLMFAMPSKALGRSMMAGLRVDEPVTSIPAREGTFADHDDTTPYAWAFEWHQTSAPRALQRLLDQGVRARVTTQPLDAMTTDGRRAFTRGTVLIPAGIQDTDVATIRQTLAHCARVDGIDIHTFTTGLTPAGGDLGSPSVMPVTAPRPLILVGPGVSAYEAGEAWHALDVRFGVATALIETDELSSVDLGEYTHVIMVNGSYSAISESTADALLDWVSDGGVVIAQKSACSWAASNLLGGSSANRARNDTPRPGDHDDEPGPTRRAYAEYDAARAVDVIGGAIFEVAVDLTHPLAFGYTQATIPVFRNSTRTLNLHRDPFSMPFAYTSEPLLSGYASAHNVEEIADTPAVIANRVGSGTVVRMVDNPNFRGVFYGTQRIFANALYFGRAVQRTGPVDEAHDEELDGHGHP